MSNFNDEGRSPAEFDRDRFCSSLNRVARILGMEGKDHFAPEAIERKAIEIVRDLVITKVRLATILSNEDAEYVRKWIEAFDTSPVVDGILAICNEALEWRKRMNLAEAEVTVLLEKMRSARSALDVKGDSRAGQ